MQLVLQGPDKLIAVPLKTALNLQVSSSVANVFDQGGKAVAASDHAPVQSNAPADLAPVTFTVHKKSP